MLIVFVVPAVGANEEKRWPLGLYLCLGCLDCSDLSDAGIRSCIFSSVGCIISVSIHRKVRLDFKVRGAV